MVALIQRVREASVSVDDEVVGRIGPGLLILLGVHRADSTVEMEWLARKCTNLRIFPDDAGNMNRSVLQTGGEILVVSQFTLYGNTAKGNRPSFIDSAHPDHAQPLYEAFAERVGLLLGKAVPTGVFGAMMDVALINDGPVTLWVERRAQSDPV